LILLPDTNDIIKKKCSFAKINSLKKMKKSFIVLASLILFASCQEQIKIGFVDNAKLISDYQKKIEIESKLQIKIDAFNKKADSIGQTFKTQAGILQEKDPKMVQKKSQEQYKMLGQQYQMFQQQMQVEEQQIQKESQTQIDSLIKEVKTFVKGYGKKNGYNYILGSNDAGSVMYGDENNDLTQTLTDALNTDFKKD
jgi:outer membrane protein